MTFRGRGASASLGMLKYLVVDNCRAVVLVVMALARKALAVVREVVVRVLLTRRRVQKSRSISGEKKCEFIRRQMGVILCFGPSHWDFNCASDRTHI